MTQKRSACHPSAARQKQNGRKKYLIPWSQNMEVRQPILLLVNHVPVDWLSHLNHTTLGVAVPLEIVLHIHY